MQIISLSERRQTAIDVERYYVSYAADLDDPAKLTGVSVSMEAHWQQFNIKGVVMLKLSFGEAADLAKRLQSFLTPGNG